MKYSLRTKISVAFFAMALILFLFISLTANFFIQRGFREYTISKLASESQSIVNQVSKRYGVDTKAWEKSGIESIGLSAMERGLIIKVVDTKNQVVWDARQYNMGFCSKMMSHMEMNMQQQNPNFNGGYVEKSYDLAEHNLVLGKIYIGYYGPYYYSDIDMKYIQTLNRVLLGAGVLALMLSLLLGAFLAKRLSKPISKVVENAKEISKGKFDIKIKENSSTKEMAELTETINSLADTLGKQEELRKRLNADVAHELRTPIATLQSHLEVMIEGIWEADKARLQELYGETVRLGKLVGDLGKIAQLEGENLVLSKREVDLHQIAESVIKVMEGGFLKKQIQLSYTGEEATIAVDEDKIRQILLNIVSNALHYTEAGGTVDVKVERISGQFSEKRRTRHKEQGKNPKSTYDRVIVQVSDTGIGIPEKDLPFIFERFYRVDTSRARNTGGSGIGLAITKALVEAHGGTISVTSEVGKGSCFTVELVDNNI